MLLITSFVLVQFVSYYGSIFAVSKFACGSVICTNDSYCLGIKKILWSLKNPSRTLDETISQPVKCLLKCLLLNVIKHAYIIAVWFLSMWLWHLLFAFYCCRLAK